MILTFPTGTLKYHTSSTSYRPLGKQLRGLITSRPKNRICSFRPHFLNFIVFTNENCNLTILNIVGSDHDISYLLIPLLHKVRKQPWSISWVAIVQNSKSSLQGKMSPVERFWFPFLTNALMLDNYSISG